MRGKKVGRRRFLGVAAAGVVGLGLWQWPEANRLRLERHTLRLPRWTLPGYKLALLADLHADDPLSLERAQRAIALALDQEPDLVLFSGDQVSTGRKSAVSAMARALGAVPRAGVPCAAVLGNHEYWAECVDQCASELHEHGVPLLRNEVLRVGEVTVAGVDDGCERKDRHDFVPRSVTSNLITLFHEPDLVERVDARSALMLAGHSHGGQMCLPLGIPVHTPRYADRYIKGYYPEARVPLYVSRGVGTVGPDVRSFCPPEVTLLTLQPSAA